MEFQWRLTEPKGKLKKRKRRIGVGTQKTNNKMADSSSHIPVINYLIINVNHSNRPIKRQILAEEILKSPALCCL